MSDTNSTAPVLLVDVSNLAYRSFFAMRGLSYAETPTGMFHGFLGAVRTLQRLTPHLVFCWDYGTPDQPKAEPWRKAIYPAYKANRKKSSDAQIVVSQLPELYSTLKLLGYPIVGVPGLEADDLFGLLSARPGNFLLYTHDDDVLQLLEGKRVQVLHRTKSWKRIQQAQVEKKCGFPVSRWPAFLAMGGDKSDNIRPLPRCGVQGARSLVLGGADPGKAYEEQPQAVQIARYATQWRLGVVGAAYAVAHIPRECSDWRIRGYVRKHPLPKHLERELSQVKERAQEFLVFCSKYGLSEMVAQRWKFFNPERG